MKASTLAIVGLGNRKAAVGKSTQTPQSHEGSCSKSTTPWDVKLGLSPESRCGQMGGASTIPEAEPWVEPLRQQLRLGGRNSSDLTL